MAARKLDGLEVLGKMKTPRPVRDGAIEGNADVFRDYQKIA